MTMTMTMAMAISGYERGRSTGYKLDHLLVSIAGQSHLRLGRPNQDGAAFLRGTGAGRTHPMLAGSVATCDLNRDITGTVLNESRAVGSELCIMSVSDGHGGREHDRSDRGSAIAVWLMLHAAILASQRLSSQPAAISDWLSHEVPRRLVQQWRRHVLLDAAEADSCSASDTDDPTETVRRYGATVFGALLTDRHSVFWHLGDGDLVVVAPDGTVSRPTMNGPSLLGTETESLCQKSAENAFRVSVQLGESHRNSLVLLASDGVSNSFVDDAGFDTFVRFISDRSRGPERISLTTSMPRWLARCTSFSGDDVSVSALLPRIDCHMPTTPTKVADTQDAIL